MPQTKPLNQAEAIELAMYEAIAAGIKPQIVVDGGSLWKAVAELESITEAHESLVQRSFVRALRTALPDYEVKLPDDWQF